MEGEFQLKIWKTIFNVGVIAAVGGVLWTAKKVIDKSSNLESRFRNYYEVLNQWVKNKNQHIEIVEYFKENDIKNIAIYGMGELGNRLYEELRTSDINIAYFIDKNAAEIYSGADDIPVVGLDEISQRDDVDAIIVTPIYDFDKIEEELINQGIDLDIISLEDIIYAL